MRKFTFSLLFLTFLFSTGNSQDLKQLRKQLSYIPGGTYIMGGGYQYKIDGFTMKYLGNSSRFETANKGGIAIGEIPESNNPELTVSVAGFYLSPYEVSNIQYKDFLVDSLLSESEAIVFWQKVYPRKEEEDSARFHWQKLFQLAAQKELLPDTACWENDFKMSFNRPMSQHYFWHPAFENYPVVGVSWKQANAYCAWLSRVNNADLAKRGKPLMPNFRLPTEAEWEYAAQGLENPVNNESNMRRRIYPWKGSRIWNEKGKYRANIKADHFNYIDDNFEYTAPVASYEANSFGLFDMAGNVSEWTEDIFRVREEYSEPSTKLDRNPVQIKQENTRVVKGGSWADYRYAAQVGSRSSMPEGLGFSRVGFRIAMTQIKNPIK